MWPQLPCHRRPTRQGQGRSVRLDPVRKGRAVSEGASALAVKAGRLGRAKRVSGLVGYPAHLARPEEQSKPRRPSGRRPGRRRGWLDRGELLGSSTCREGRKEQEHDLEGPSCPPRGWLAT